MLDSRWCSSGRSNLFRVVRHYRKFEPRKMFRLISPPDGAPVSQGHAVPHVGHQSSSLRTQTFQYGDWTVTITQAPILGSQCTCARDHNSAVSPAPVVSPSVESSSPHRKCVFCRHESELTLEHLPDMAFVENKLRIENTNGHFGIEFNAVDAVNSIGERASGDVQVASANVWQESRSEALKTFGSKTVQYDWTYTPNYTGTLFGGMHAEKSDETLNQETIKRRDQVLLFEEVQLYGDELDDNGCAEMDLKILAGIGILRWDPLTKENRQPWFASPFSSSGRRVVLLTANREQGDIFSGELMIS